MKTWIIPAALALLMISIFLIYSVFWGGEWQGVDEAVVKKFADQAGHPACEPFINTDRGDLLLFCFLMAGTVSGFVMGYYWRRLFPPPNNPEQLDGRPTV